MKKKFKYVCYEKEEYLEDKNFKETCKLLNKWAIKLCLPEPSCIKVEYAKNDKYGNPNNAYTMYVRHDYNHYRQYLVYVSSSFLEDCTKRKKEYHCLHEVLHMVLSDFYLSTRKVLQNRASDLDVESFHNKQETVITDLTYAVLKTYRKALKKGRENDKRQNIL